MPVIRRALNVGWDNVVNFNNSHPITTLQVAAGAGLYFAYATGIVGESVLFHPANFGLTNAYSGVTSSLFLGLGLFDSLRRGYSLVTYGGSVEQILDGPGDIVRGGNVANPGSSRIGPDGQRKPIWAWLLGSRYFKVQAVTIGAIVVAELLLSPGPLVYRGRRMYTPYSLAPVLEYASMFLYSFLAPPASTVSFMGLTPQLPTIAVPWLYCATGVFVSLRECLVGMVASLVAAKFVGLKRANGEDIHVWYVKEIRYWGKMVLDFVKAAGGSSGGSQRSFGAGRRLGDD
jgi:hypothetical protein